MPSASVRRSRSPTDLRSACRWTESRFQGLTDGPTQEKKRRALERSRARRFVCIIARCEQRLAWLKRQCAEAEAWFDEATLGALEERERLTQDLGDVDAELQTLVAEMLAVKEEIERGQHSVRRLQEMEEGQERNRAKATKLLERKKVLAASLEALG